MKKGREVSQIEISKDAGRDGARKSPADRFAGKTRPLANGCILWIGQIDKDGYGQFSYASGTVRAHRFGYELVRGAIPAGLQIDHLCRNRACVNPDHLEAVTPRENTLRSTAVTAENAKKTHCPAGHPYSGANLTVRNGRRFCRACQVVHVRAHFERKAALA